MNKIIQPYLTEKSAAAVDKGLYVFLIEKNANKTTVTQELTKLYTVTPTSVRIVNLPAKKVNFKRRPGVRNQIRKAYVQLPPKQKIPGFESLTEKDDKKAKAVEAKETK